MSPFDRDKHGGSERLQNLLWVRWMVQKGDKIFQENVVVIQTFLFQSRFREELFKDGPVGFCQGFEPLFTYLIFK